MRPKSAMFYLEDVDETSEQLLHLLENHLDKNRDSTDLNNCLQKYALDSIAIMFLGFHVGVLEGSEEGIKLAKSLETVLNSLWQLTVMPDWMLKLTGVHSSYVKETIFVFNTCNRMISEAIAKHNKDGSLEGSVLLKLIKRCGPDSQLPIVMGIDALTAGIDTTTNSLNILLYLLANNPDKQDKLYDEIITVVGKDGKLNEAKLSRIRYLKVRSPISIIQQQIFCMYSDAHIIY